MNGYLYKYLSPLGDITLASNGEALTGLWFDGQKYFDPALTATYVERSFLCLLRLLNGWNDISTENFRVYRLPFNRKVPLSGKLCGIY